MAGLHTEATLGHSDFDKGIERLNQGLDSVEKQNEAVNAAFQAAIREQEQAVNSLSQALGDLQKQRQEALEGLNEQQGKIDGMKASGIAPSESDLADLEWAKKNLENLDKSIEGTTKQLSEQKNQLSKTNSGYKEWQKTLTLTKDQTEALSASLTKIGKGALALVGISGLTSFVKKVAEVRGEFQKLEVSFETMLGSKDKADALMQDVIDLAAKTPFFVSDVAKGAKQLLAYGESADTAVDTLKRLGDVAAGMGIRLDRMVGIYGRVMSYGKLTNRIMLQFRSAGIPIVQALADSLGKSEKEVKALIDSGKIGFSQVKQAIIGMTNEGGKFANLTEKLSQTITGKISVFQGLVQNMFNDIGKSTEGPIAGVIDLGIALVNNYKAVGAAVGALVAAYGAERAVLIAMAAARGISTKEVIAETVAKLRNTVVTDATTRSQLGLNAAILANPYVAAAVAVAGLTAAIVLLATRSTAAEKAQKALEKGQSEITANIAKEQGELDRLEGQLKSAEKGTAAWTRAKNEAVSKFGKYYSNLGDEIERTGTLASSYGVVAEGIMKAARARQYFQYIESQKSSLDDDTAKRLEQIRRGLYGSDKWYDRGALEANMVIPDVGQVTKEFADKIWSQVVNYIYQGSEMTADVTKALEYLGGGRWGKVFEGSLMSIAEKARTSTVALDKLNSTAKEYFQVTDEDLAKWNTNGDLTPDDDPDGKTPEQLASEALKRKQAERKYAEGVIDANKQAELDIRQAEIDNMEEGNEKVLKQIELDYDTLIAANEARAKEWQEALKDNMVNEWLDKNPNATEQQKDDYRQSLNVTNADLNPQLKARLKAYDAAANEAKAKALRDMRAEYDTHYESLDRLIRDWERKIAEQEALVNNEEFAAFKEHNKAILEEMKRRRDVEVTGAAYEGVAEYGSLNTKKNALKAYWEAQIAAAPDVLKPGMQQAMEKALQELNYEALKTKVDWDAVFGDLSSQGSKSIAANLDTVRNLLATKAGELSVEEISELENALASMADELSSRNPFAAMALSMQSVRAAKNDVVAAMEEYKLAKAELDAQEAAQQAQELLLQEQLQNGTITQTEYDRKLQAEEAKTAGAQNKLTQATQKLNGAQSRVVSSTLEFMSALNKSKGVIGEVAGSVSDLIGIFDDDVANVLRDAIGLFEEVGDTAMEITEMFVKEGEDLVEGLSDTAEGVAEGVTKTSEATAAAISAAEAASVILLIIKAAIKVVTAIFSIIKANEEANNRAAEAARKYELALEKLNDAARLENLKNAFGKDAYGQFKAFNEQLLEASGNLNTLENDMGATTKTLRNWGMVALGVLGVFALSPIQMAKSLNDAAKGTGQVSAQLVADMRSGWQKFWGSSKNIVTASLSDFYDENGQLNGKKLQEWYDQYGDYLDDATKKTVDSMLEEWERYEEAMEGMNDYMADLFGDVASNVAELMVDKFIEGGDALADMTDLAKDFGKQMAKSMVTSMLMTEVFTQDAQEQMKQMLLAGNGAGAIQFYNNLLDKAGQSAPAITEFLRGIGLAQDSIDTRTSAAAGVAQASQDSVDKLEGRAAVMQGHTFNIQENTGTLVSNSVLVLQHLSEIEGYVALLGSISSRIGELRDMAAGNKGIKVR